MEAEYVKVSKSYKTHEPTFMKKLLQVYWVNPKSWRLDEFVINDEILTFKTQDGKELTAPITELSIKVQTDKYDRKEVFVKHDKQKLHFKEIDGMLKDEEWEEIFNILDSIPDTGMTALGWITTTAKIVLRELE